LLQVTEHLRKPRCQDRHRCRRCRGALQPLDQRTAPFPRDEFVHWTRSRGADDAQRVTRRPRLLVQPGPTTP
jgi:hypothetical protein